MNVFMFIGFILIFISFSAALNCYVCGSITTDSPCYYGSESVVSKKVDNASLCLAFQLVVRPKEGGSYIRTIRGYHNGTDPCVQLMQEHKTRDGTVERGKSCRVCRENLCNNGATSSSSLVALLLVAMLRKC